MNEEELSNAVGIMLDKLNITLNEPKELMSEKIHIRVTFKQKNKYRLLAKIYSLSLSDFMRTRPDIAYESFMTVKTGQRYVLTKSDLKDLARKLQKPPRISEKVKFAKPTNGNLKDMADVQTELGPILDKRRKELDKILDEIDRTEM